MDECRTSEVVDYGLIWIDVRENLHKNMVV